MATAWGNAAYVKANSGQRVKVTVSGVFTGWLAIGPGGAIIDSSPKRYGAAAGWRTLAHAKAAAVGVDNGWTVM